MSKKYLVCGFIGTTVLFPLTTHAATGATLSDFVHVIIYYLNIVLVLFMAVAIVMFTFYVIKYYVMPNENRKEGNLYVMYSVIGFFVILSFWGIVNIVQNSFGLGNDSNRPGNWDSFSNIFPGGSSSGGSLGSNNVFNQGVPSYNSRLLQISTTLPIFL